jgi:rhamnosyltransferase subunit B
VSARVHVAEFAPHAALFARAAIVVHQGGAGTLHQALANGRPTLVVPHSHDQPDNARRVAALGVSRTLMPRQYRIAAVERELRELMRPEYARRAQEVANVVRQENGPRAAAAAIESVLEH